MSQQIARVRYFDGEYLGAGDFTAEQTYHLTMRRNLNRYLHLYGIVYGLNLTTTDESGILSFAISSGLAIDAAGREILLLSPRTITEDDLVPTRINKQGTYQVWIRYSEQASQLPANGYGLCNDATENTRFTETSEVLIVSSADAPTPPSPGDPPATGDIPGVLLGTVTVDTQIKITAATDDNANRLYIGLRAQQIIAPKDTGAAFDILAAQTATNPPVSLGVNTNLFAQRNLITGADFTVDKNKFKPSAPTTGFPKPNGNVKVGGDLFLSGDVFSISGTDWVALDERIRRVSSSVAKGLVPEVQTDIFPVPLEPTQMVSPATNTFTIPIKTDLKGKARMVVGIAEIEWLSREDFAKWTTVIDADATGKKTPIQLHLAVQDPPSATTSGFDFTVRWTVGPTDTTNHLLPIKTLTLSYTAVILPS